MKLGLQVPLNSSETLINFASRQSRVSSKANFPDADLWSFCASSPKHKITTSNRRESSNGFFHWILGRRKIHASLILRSCLKPRISR
jgi:hypothetical protein